MRGDVRQAHGPPAPLPNPSPARGEGLEARVVLGLAPFLCIIRVVNDPRAFLLPARGEKVPEGRMRGDARQAHGPPASSPQPLSREGRELEGAHHTIGSKANNEA